MGLFTQQRFFLRWTKPVPKDNSAFSQETRLNNSLGLFLHAERHEQESAAIAHECKTDANQKSSLQRWEWWYFPASEWSDPDEPKPCF